MTGVDIDTRHPVTASDGVASANTGEREGLPMEKRYRVYYKAHGLHGYGLTPNPDEEKTPAGIRAAIDRQNEAAKEHDHAPEQYAIYRVSVLSMFDDEGILCSRSEFEARTEIYPAEPDTTPRYTVKNGDGRTPHIMSSYDVIKAVTVCENFPGSYVEKNTGEIVYRSSKTERR